MRSSGPLVALVLVLAAANGAVQLLVPRAGLVVGGCLLAASAGISCWAGLSRKDLGLSRETCSRGLRWSWWILVLAVVIFAIALLMPWVRGLVEAAPPDTRNPWLRVLVTIPFGTVLVEEFAFRGVLWSLLNRRFDGRAAMWGSAAAFGLWHVLSAFGGGAANAALEAVGGGSSAVFRLVGTMGLTAVAGMLLAVLRARSGSLFPSMALHWAANSLGVLFVTVVAT